MPQSNSLDVAFDLLCELYPEVRGMQESMRCHSEAHSRRLAMQERLTSAMLPPDGDFDRPPGGNVEQHGAEVKTFKGGNIGADKEMYITVPATLPQQKYKVLAWEVLMGDIKPSRHNGSLWKQSRPTGILFHCEGGKVFWQAALGGELEEV